MDLPFDRREVLQGLSVLGGLAFVSSTHASTGPIRRVLHRHHPGWVEGHMTGAQAVVETLLQEGVECVYGIPGAQENELWDTFKSKGLPYLLVTHEFSAACMADGYARALGKPGVLCVVPGPGVTNSLSGLGEALVDSIPMVCIVGDIAKGDKYRPFQVHCLDQEALLKPVTKGVFSVEQVADIPKAIRQAFALANSGEPGPTAVVIPYPLFIETHHFKCPPFGLMEVPFDETAFRQAVALLSDRKLKIGIYAGQGCMNYSEQLVAVAELLQAPVATSVSGKGVMPDCHPLAVGYGYGPQGTITAEKIFNGGLLPHRTDVDCVLAIGVRYSEVSTGFYANPQTKHVIHVDANANNLGQVMKTSVCVHADAGAFLSQLLANTDCLRRPADTHLLSKIRKLKAEENKHYAERYARCGIDPMDLILTLRKCLPEDGLTFVDVTVSEHLAAEAFKVFKPRTYFNPTDNQAMGWSIPAAIGAKRVLPDRAVLTITGDGCFLMSAMEISTAAREQIPVKFFILDDQAYHYMQMLQEAAYLRTTATILTRLDYAALAKGWGIAYCDIHRADTLEQSIHNVLCHPGPILVRVAIDYGERKIRWLEAVRDRYVKELSAAQKARFLARAGSRAVQFRKAND